MREKRSSSTSQRSSFLVIITVVAASLVLSSCIRSSIKDLDDGAGSEAGSATTPQTTQPTATSDARASVSAPSVQTRLATPKQGLLVLAQTLAYYAHDSQSLEGLMKYLSDSGQKPKMYENNSSDIGSLTVVRTDRPPIGTRYFYAEYLSDGHGQKPFASHMSFEYQPGPNSMSEARAAVQEAFGPQLKNPSHDRNDFVQWELGDGYVIWVKKLDQQDITDHPYFAYGPGDVGTIKITIELSPH